MRILFDHNVPVPLRFTLAAHHVETAYERGWSQLLNGDLIHAAETHGFDLLITTDRGFHYQQNWVGRTIGLMIVSTNDWKRIRLVKDRIAVTVDSMRASQYVEFDIP